jgi:TadE-like protein
VAGGVGRARSPVRPRRAGGQATVEFALALPVIVLALLLVIQLALVARSQILVVNAARAGARAAAVGESPAGAAATTPGLDAGRLTVASSGGGPPGSMVTVTVRYRSPTDVPLVGRLLGDPSLQASVAMRVEGPSYG